MLARFLAGGACAVGMLVAVSITPAAANPYDQQVRGSGRSFFATLFGPSTARTVVSYPGSQKPGTIIISTAQRRLYLVLGNGQALSYAIGVGREGFSWSGATQISAKREWPDWTPPAQMLHRRPDLPRHMAGGIDNPLGAVVGGLLVGIAENLIGTYLIGTELKLPLALLLIVTVLVLRPAGLLGRVVVKRV